MKEKDEGDWIIQYSWKNRQDMLNLRGKTVEQFLVDLANVKENIELFRDAGTFFESQQSLPIGDVRATPPAEPQKAAPVTVKTDSGTEVGPIRIEKVEHQEGIGKSGRPYVRHIVNLAGGVKASTFDSLVADAAQHLLGRDCYARVEKGKFGYELLNIRPAA